MKFHVRHIFYLAGLVAILTSYLLFISMPFVSLIILGVAFLISISAFVLIVSKDDLKLILVFLLLGIITLYFRSSFKEWSMFRYYNSVLTKNEKIFEKVNAILTSKSENVYYPPIPGHEDSILSVVEIKILDQFLKETNVNYLRKDRQKIFYPIWGVPLEMDYGIFYFYSDSTPTRYFKHLKGKWYFD
jgi:hypothetical protein